MTNITLPRAELQQVLEAMENFGTDWDGWHRAYMALRERLAQPEQEPVALPCCGYADASAIKWNPYNQVVQCHNCGQTYTAPPQRKPQPEPDGLSWLKKDSNYFSQPKRKPLTDEEIRHFWREATMKPKYTSEFIKDFARAIEAAHGIKGET